MLRFLRLVRSAFSCCVCAIKNAEDGRYILCTSLFNSGSNWSKSMYVVLIPGDPNKMFLKRDTFIKVLHRRLSRN